MITDNIQTIQKKIKGSTAQLIAVSKQQPDDRVQAALDYGVRVFGENRVQEAMERWDSRRSIYPNLELHLIGPLQTNKVKQAISLFDVIHTLDREKLASAIYKHAPDMPCFIQVNVGNEPQKSGVLKQDVDRFYQYCVDLGMNIIGLMCIPPNGVDPTPYFQWMQDKVKVLGLEKLSMGMSYDYEIAIQYGATHVRVGSALFGAR